VRTLSGAFVLGLVTAVALAAPWIAPVSPFALSDAVLAGPSAAHWFGTDDLGRDVFAGVVHGARTALIIGVLSASLASLIGGLVGGVAGLAGGWPDEVLMRGAEFFQAMPRLLLVIVVVTFFGHHFALIAVVIGLAYWPSVARLVRGQVMILRGADVVTAARAVGAGPARVLVRHVLPATMAPAATQAAFHAGGAVLMESGLSFLGLGDPSVMSWGAMLTEAHHWMRDAWWIGTFPGLAIAVTVLGWTLLADVVGGPPPELRDLRPDRGPAPS
jgi:peptide/nickel transport system permease protein